MEPLIIPDFASRFKFLQSYFPTAFITVAFVILILGGLGLLGNVLSVPILFGRSMRYKKLTLFLTCLLIWDSGSIVGICWSSGVVNCLIFLLTGNTDYIEWLSIYEYTHISVGITMTSWS